MRPIEISPLKLGIMMIVSLVIALLSSMGAFSGLQAIGLSVAGKISEPIAGATSQIDSVLSLLGNLQQVQTDNLALQNEVGELSQQLAALQELQAENTALATQLNLHLSQQLPHQLARVLKYEYLPSPGYVFVETASDSTIMEGDLAVKYNYIVGEVVKVLPGYAKVRLINSVDTAISVRVGSRSAIGVLRGKSGISVVVGGIDQDAQVSEGDNIQLLAPQGVDLKDYIFGKVSSILSSESDPSKQFDVEIPVDLSKLDYLFLIPNHG